MTDHFCQYIRHDGAGLDDTTTYAPCEDNPSACGKPARFTWHYGGDDGLCSCVGAHGSNCANCVESFWLCADHYDQHIQIVEAAV